MGGRRPRKKNGEVLRQKLLDEFGTMLDESLILAMVDERDVKDEYDAIRGDLLMLAATVVDEQATGFDPSGLGCWADAEGQASDETATTMGNGPSTENATTISDGSDSDAPTFGIQGNASEADKIMDLRQIFPNFKEHTLRFVLKGCDGVIERAFDDLMTRQALEEEGELPKGVDGFYQLGYDGSQSSRKTRNRKGKQKLELSYSVVSPTIADGELEGGSGPIPTPKTPRSPATPMSTWQTPKSPVTYVSAMPDMEASRANLRSASALAKLGPLGRQGAAYYVERARAEAERSINKASKDAEALVDGRSTSTKIDLHGVTVMDGVKIAKRRVWLWWDQLGEGRDRIAKQQGFTVVTGIGRHSANGVSRLRQAVGAALKNEGWKIEPLTGQFYITGRA